MTVKNAIQILEWWIEQKNQSIKELKTNSNLHDKELEESLITSETTIISNLEIIKKEIIPRRIRYKKWNFDLWKFSNHWVWHSCSYVESMEYQRRIS